MAEAVYNQCPSWALSVGYMGVVSAAILSNWGSAVSFVELFCPSRFDSCDRAGISTVDTRVIVGDLWLYSNRFLGRMVKSVAVAMNEPVVFLLWYSWLHFVM
jgi:hypothetical protein